MDVEWQFTGKILVDIDETVSYWNQMQEHYGGMAFTFPNQPICGVEVRVQASASVGSWTSWGTTTSQADGSFSLTTTRRDDARLFRAQIRLKGDDLQVRWGSLEANLVASLVPSAHNSPWITVWESSHTRRPPTVAVPEVHFAEGASGELGGDFYRSAVTWYLTRSLMDRLLAEDSWIAFKHKINVIYPGPTISHDPYANGVYRSVYIPKPTWTVDTVLHEVMHLWNYQHNHGTTNWLFAVCGSTVSDQEQPYVAFHEGFADYAMEDILHQIWGFPKILPENRRVMSVNYATTRGALDLLERNHRGVIGALHLLTAQNIYSLDFGTRDEPFVGYTAQRLPLQKGRKCPTPPNLIFWDVLKVFRADPDAGWPRDWEVGRASYGVFRFFQRASDILGTRFDADSLALYLSLLDATSTAQPRDRCQLNIRLPGVLP